VPVEAKPLFRPDVLRSHLAAFRVPDRLAASSPLRSRVAHWSELVSSGRADAFKEREILPDFLTDLFGGVLGYTSPAENADRYTLSREQHVQVEGEFADAVLGEFSPEKRSFTAVVEGKGPRDPLDRPFGGRRLAAVEQAYRYAVNLPCDWIVATNIRETRLYSKFGDFRTYEAIETARLAGDEAHLQRFVFLLGAERVVPTTGRCHLYALHDESERAGVELTRAFYVQYANLRQDVFERLRAENPDVPAETLLALTQKLLDRVLFCAFCEDRALLPAESLKRAFEHHDPYNPRPVFENFRGLFRAVNAGNPSLRIPAYNGGLFADDPLLDGLKVSDEVCAHFKALGDYDYRPAHLAAESAPAGETASEPVGHSVDVDILGHIFEQSITDLERLRDAVVPAEVQAAAEAVTPDKLRSRRKREGAFYTPPFITRYIVEGTLGLLLRERCEHLRMAHAETAEGTARTALADPKAYDVETLKKPAREALIRFWETWQAELETIKVLDPACGSGAFLIQAFDLLYAEYQACNDRLAELRGHRTLFDPDRTILEKNIYGVDLNEEAVEICRLSLWIKTAQRGKPLTSLDHNIRCGNSLVADATVHPKAFDWQAAFPEVFAQNGFDVAIGNPPYVRQELLGPYKPHFEQQYRSFHGMADLYVYFYELGLRVLRPGGRLSYIVTNKWLKAGYAEPLRRFFASDAWVESVVDFGHAKQIFEDADVFPCIIVARKPLAAGAVAPASTRVCAIPREQLRIHDLSRQIAEEGFSVPRQSLGDAGWQLEPPAVNDLLKKIRAAGVPLAEFAGVKPLYGIKTGFNEAFLIDTPTKEALCKADPKCAEIIKPYLRGQDVARWHAEWAGLWMIVLKSSENHPWPWADAGEQAEAIFKTTYPSLHAHVKQYEAALRKRQDQGWHWWELRACVYYDAFEKPKVVYQEIQFHPGYALDTVGMFGNNKTFLVANADLWLLAVLNSPLIWWHNWRYLPHMKDEALSPTGVKMEAFPVAKPSAQARAAAEKNVTRLIEITKAQQSATRDLLDWLRVEHEVAKPSLRLQALAELSSDEFVSEVKKARSKKGLTAAGLKSLRDEHTRLIVPTQTQAAEALELECALSAIVNSAYGLTPAEEKLLWQTAPPRMPIAPKEP